MLIIKKSLLLFMIFAVFMGSSLIAQDEDQTATETEDLVESMSTAAAASEPLGLAQNDDTRRLEEIIYYYNNVFISERPDLELEPITEISERTLVQLIRQRLIPRTDLSRYLDMLLINGRVFVREEEQEPEPEPEIEPEPEVSPADENLMGVLLTSSDRLSQDLTRGVSPGTPVRQNYESREEFLRLRGLQMIYRVPVFPAPVPVSIRGKPVVSHDDYLSTLESDGR